MELLKQLEAYIMNDNIQNAYELISKHEQNYVDSSEFWNLRGVLCLKVGDYNGALDFLGEALNRDPHNADAYYNYAYAFDQLGDTITAARYFGLAYRFSEDEAVKDHLSSLYRDHRELKEVFEETALQKVEETPSVSIIIPAYNQKEFLKQAVESALSQDYPNLEVIVADDHSTDGTDEMMKNYLHYPNLKYIRREKNLGAGNNSGDALYHHCNSKYVMILNHDDYLTDQQYLSKAVQLFKTYPNLSLVWANCHIKNEENGQFVTTNYDLPKITNGRKYFLQYEKGDYKHITGFLTTLFDRERAVRFHCFKEKTRARDLFVYLKLMLAGDVGFIYEPVAVYRVHNKSISKNMPVAYDYSTMDELEHLSAFAEQKGFNRMQLKDWLTVRLLSYFRWRINTLKQTGKHSLAAQLLTNVIKRYPHLRQYLSVISNHTQVNSNNNIKENHEPKIFCIGANKTGTTSLKKAFEDLGYKVGNQRQAELLLHPFLNGNYQVIVDYCYSAQVFQDFPFSWPELYKYLDKAFPNSKFILTVRDSSEQWYQSITKFHAKLYGKGKIPTKEDLMNATYIFKGRPWITHSAKFHVPEHDPYNKKILIDQYEKYNRDVIEYFKNRPDDLLVLNLSDEDAYEKFCEFLNIDSPFDKFPWENKTESLMIMK